MYVCVCNAVSHKELREHFDEGAKSVADLQMKTGAGTCCGTCLAMVDDLVNEWGPSVPYVPADPAVAAGTGVTATNPPPAEVQSVRPARP